LTQAQLGEVVEVDGNTISRYERGAIKPSIETLQHFADFFGVPVDEILNGPAEDSFTVTLKYVKTLEEVSEEMNMNGVSLTVADNGFVGISGGKKFQTREDIDKAVEEIRYMLNVGFDTRERMAADKKKLEK
jgi:transcriptional regulator with XRE-family HTH domain